MKSLLKEFTGIPMGQKPDLKKSDSSDAGKSDVAGKVKPNDITFSLMRNTINSDGEVSGSDVANYLERAAELNDEVDTVPFGLETDDGDVVKVYVNAEQAEKFEEEMKKLLGIEDDVEEAINKLALKFDIVDVIWPKNKEGGESEQDLELGDDDQFDALDDGDDEMEEVARYDELKEAVVETGSASDEVEDPKAPTSEEAAAYSKLMRIVMNLAAMGPSGVSAATGYDRSNMTKLEMIKEYVKENYADDAELARTWISRVGDSMNDSRDILPYWLKEQLEAEESLDNEEEHAMTIGTQFLARLNEGKKPEAKKGYKFDPATEAMKRQLRDIGGEKNFADKIAEVAAMSGMPGRFMNTPEGRESILDGAASLRSRPAAVAAFLALHSALSTFHGVTPMVEGKKDEEELDGVAFQQLVEEVLITLGLPASLVSAGGKAGSKAPVKRTIAELMRDSNVKVAYQFLAKKLGIKLNDGAVGVKKAGVKKVDEAVGADPAAVKIFNKIKGTPNLKTSTVKAMVVKYLDMVGKQEKHVPMLTADVITMLQDADLMEAFGAEAEAEVAPNPKTQIKVANEKNLAGHALAMIQALNLPLNTGFVRNMSKPMEQMKMNSLISKNPGLKRAVLAFAASTK